MKPGTAYGAICSCGNSQCGCGTTCCSGFTDFCCSVNGGYNYCPNNTVMGGWWKAGNSSFCGGPRYYMDCNATCQCATGCGSGFPFCDTDCDGTNCGCGPDGCDSFMVGCLQFRYGQCNQDVTCMGRIVCRVVACVPALGGRSDLHDRGGRRQRDGRAERGVLDDGAAVASVRVAGDELPGGRAASSVDGAGYALLTSFGKIFSYGDFPADGDESTTLLNRPIVGMTATPTGKGYWFVAADGGIFSFGDAQFYGSMGGTPEQARGRYGRDADGRATGSWRRRRHLQFRRRPVLRVHGRHGPEQPVVGMAATPTARATGSWRPTAASSVSATPSSTGPWEARS